MTGRGAGTGTGGSPWGGGEDVAHDPLEPLPVDPDVDIAAPAQVRELTRAPWSVLSVIALGGALGALARYGLQLAFPTGPAGFPWATFAINVVGCLLIGGVAVLALRVLAHRPLVRPFFGVGILGGFTTFSTYVVDLSRLFDGRAFGVAAAYLVGTLAAALVAAHTGIAIAEWLVARLSPGRPG
jgi:CrcB protein